MITSQSTPIPSEIDGAKPNLYALLVGIGAYDRVRQLRGPVGDVTALATYLGQLPDLAPHLLTLTDAQASKPAVIAGFQTHLSQAGPADTALFYFSGHGAQEAADTKLWTTETDGQLECLVCHDKDTVNTWEFLLADKELRYLIGEVGKAGAHIVVISDCCHSGDNTRAVPLLAEAFAGRDMRERQLAESAPRRPYEGFFFHDGLPMSQLQAQGPEVAIPQGTHIQMAACESDELAVEVNGEGIFTKNLLAVLEAAHGQVSYRDLHNRVRQYMRFGYEQRPRVYVPGEQASSLLIRGFLNQPIDQNNLTASATYNKRQGWLLDVGAIHGVGQTNQAIQLYDAATKTSYEAAISRIGADYTVLKIADAVGATLDKTAVYRATIDGLLTEPIRLHLTNHGGPSTDLPDLLHQLMTRSDSARQTTQTFFIPEDDETKADYTLHIRNGLYYLTRPADENRPLIRPVRADDPQAMVWLTDYLHHLSQWQYLKNLRNPAVSQPILTVELTPNTGNPMALTDAHSGLIPITFTENNGRWATTLALKLSNPTTQPLYCTALYLSRDFMAFPGFLPTNYRLEPGQAVTLGPADSKAPTGRQTSFQPKLEEVIRQYNWPGATEHFKLLITTDPLSETTLSFLTLDALPSPPILTDKLKAVANRGAFDIDADEGEVLPDWSTQTISFNLQNPLYNTVRADELSQMLTPPTDASQEDIMADFALGLYYEISLTDTLQPELKLRDEIQVLTPDEGQRGLWTDLKIAVANKAARWTQNRQYVQNLVRYPDRVRIVAEGDSWFQYPFLLRDVVDYLSGVYNVFSVAAAGATLDDYLNDSTFLETIAQVKPTYFLLSGGGNDLLGTTFPSLISDTPNPAKTGPESYLSDAFAQQLAAVGDRYKRILRLVQLGYPDVKVVVHGYDYVIPVDGTAADTRVSWLGKTLITKGMQQQTEREAFVRYLLDAFNEQLRQIAATYTNVTYLNLRGTVRHTDRVLDNWYDEIHPNDKGFLSVSSKFIEVINGKKTEANNPSALADPSNPIDPSDRPVPSPLGRGATDASTSPPNDGVGAVGSRWPDAFLWNKRKQGDPIADAVITTLLDENQKGEVDLIFQMLVRNRQFPNPAFDVLPDAVKQVVEGYFVHTRTLPAYADKFKLMIAADVFKLHGPKILMILLCKSLPTCYTCWRGAKVLYRTGRLRVHDGSLDAFSRRLMETAQFVVDMLTRNNFEQDGTAIVGTQKVRLMHAIIRHFAQERNWDVETYGIPINQEDLVGTLLSFGVVIIDGLEQLDITLTLEQRAGYLHLWHVVGNMMGIDEDLLSEDEDDCRALMNAILDQQSGPSMEGAELTQACIDLMNSRLIVGPLKRLSPFFVRFFVGDTYADMLSVEKVDADNSVIMNAVQWFDQSVRGLDDRNVLMAALGRAFSNEMIQQVLNFTNAAKSEQFYMPSALTDTWETTQADFRIPPIEHIEDAIAYLDKVARLFRSQNNPVGYFCAVYKLVTQLVAGGLRAGAFTNPVAMEQVDVGFCNRYFEAINQYFDGKPASAPWQVAFDAAQALLTTDQHIFAAANAHISFDLPIVVAAVFRGKDLNLFAADYAKMNEYFDGMFDQMNEDIARIFRPFGLAVEHFAENLKAAESAAMKKGRDMAWANTLLLHDAPTDADRQALIAKMETDAAAMGRTITQPPALLRVPLELIAKQEFGTVAHKVDQMLRTALLPSQ